MPANDNASINSDRYPLKDVVICSTSVPSDVRTKLAQAAEEMGASHQLDLTGDVTHLLVGKSDTEKYRYVARERPDVRVLRPEWVEAVKEAWKEGGETDVHALEEKYRYPTFACLKICVTGIIDTEERNRVASIVQENGAEYHGDLTKQVTHLVVAKPRGAKYTAMRNWGLPTVSVKWLEDSVRRQMFLEPRFYNPETSLEEQGKGAYKLEMSSRTSLGKRPREAESQGGGDVGKRRLRRTASRRLEGNSQGMWQDISTSDASAKPKEVDQWRSNGQDNVPDSRETGARSETDRPKTADPQAFQEASANLDGLFSGWYVVVKGFEKGKATRLSNFLLSNGARVIDREQDLEGASSIPLFKGRCICVPHNQPTQTLGFDTAPAGTVFATEWWVERCIHYKRFIDPEDDILSQPLGDVGALDLGNMTIAVSGFTGVDYRQAAEAIKLTGATLAERVAPNISVLVNGGTSVRREKAMYAAMHGFPVVGATWLWETLKAKTQADIGQFKIELPPADQLGSFGEPATSSPAPSDMMKSSHANARKDNQQLARLSNTRKRHATPMLALKAARSMQPPAPRPSGPFVHEDDDDDDEIVTTVQDDSVDHLVLPLRVLHHQPLTNISPNASPHKLQPFVEKRSSKPAKSASPPIADQSIEQLDATSTKPTSSLGPAEPTPPPPPDYTASLASIASLMSQRRGTSRLGTSSSTSDPTQPRQKPRKLGRAESNSNLTNRSHSGATDLSMRQDVYDLAEGEHASSAPVAQQPPSTQLGYETPEAEAARLMMAKKLGTIIGDESSGTRLKSLGTVKDAASGGGGSAKAKGGRRTGK